MNCRKVTWILDNQTVEKIDATQKGEAEAHLAGCAECASAWQLQAGLAALPCMKIPADFASRCRQLVTTRTPSITAVTASRRTGARLLATVFVALAAAAAIMVAILPRRSAVTLSAAGALPAATTPAHPAGPGVALAEKNTTGDLLPAMALETSTDWHFLVRVVRPGSESETSSGSSAFSTALLEQASAYGKAPSTKLTVDSLYDALIAELHVVPGLTLVESDFTKMEPSSSRKYQLQIGPVIMTAPDGKLMHNSRYIAVSLSVEQIRANGKTTTGFPDMAAIDLQAPCTGAAPVADSPCPDVRGTAAAMVRKLRQEVFPPDPSLIRAMQAKFQDSSLGTAQRSKLLADLLKLQDSLEDTSLLRDPGVVRAAIGLATSADPALRARIWRTLRGTGKPELIEPLLTSLLQDPVEVRLAALETLADFRDDQRVRSRLESVILEDPRPLVRAVAERSLSGEEPWRHYVVASLKDSSRPAPQRVEALEYYLYPPGPERSSSHPQYRQLMQELLDDGAVSALAQTLADTGAMKGSRSNFVGNFAGQHSRNPEVTAMLVKIVEHDPKPVMRSVAGEVLARMHTNEPAVREVLTRVLASDPDPQVREYIRERMPPDAP